MQCPNCGAVKNIKWFLRHQKVDENDETTDANVITILCTECGHNSTFFLADCLEDIFPEWKEPQGTTQDDINNLAALFGMFNNSMNFPEELYEEESETPIDDE